MCIFGLIHDMFGEGNGTPLQSSCLENPMDGGAWWAAVHGVAKSRTWLSGFTFTHWRRKWQPTPVFLPGESQGRRSLVGCCLWGRTESDTTEATAAPAAAAAAGHVVIVQSLSRIRLLATQRTAMCQASPSFTVSQSLLKFMSIELMMLSNQIILHCPLLLLPSIFPSIRIFSNDSGHFLWVSFSHQVAKVLERQHQFYQWVKRVDFLYWLIWSPCCPRDSQESSATPQCNGINSLVLSLL